MRKDLMRRLRRLESRFQEMNRRVVLVWITHRVEAARREALADNERIVCDLYREIGQCGSARERITTDPADEGRECPPRGCLEDVIRELHENCEGRDRGGCRDCHGLEHLFSAAGSENLQQSEPLTGTTKRPSPLS
jgi:hypothetical protein